MFSVTFQIYYMDNLRHDLNNDSMQTVPRAALFMRRKIELLTRANKWINPSVRVTYGKLKVNRAQSNTFPLVHTTLMGFILF